MHGHRLLWQSLLIVYNIALPGVIPIPITELVLYIIDTSLNCYDVLCRVHSNCISEFCQQLQGAYS